MKTRQSAAVPGVALSKPGWKGTKTAALAAAVALAMLSPALIMPGAGAAELNPGDAVERLPGTPDTIWFDSPMSTSGDAQREWENRALPIGNGALGAVVYGGVANEKLQLNEKTLWTGGPGAPGGYNYGNWTDGRGPEDMQAVRDLIANSPTKGVSAATVAQKLGQPKKNFGSYQTFGELKLDMAGLGEAVDYRRGLNISDSVVTTSFTSEGVHYTREYFATAADDVIAMRITADQPGKIGFTARLDLTGERLDVSNTAADGRITTKGKLSNGMRFESQVQVLTEGGSRSEDSGKGQVSVANANSATVIFSAATDFAMDYATDYRNGVDPHGAVAETVSAAASLGFASLSQRHKADYKGLFDRATLDLGGAELPNIPTNQLLANYRRGTDQASARALETLYFKYGRYLLISSSRDGSLPANLQGVWNRSNNPPWDSDYHVNINFQMNYWPAESTNLSETADPFFDYVDSMVAPGTVTATDMYGSRGWVTGNETNPFGFTGLHNYPESFWQPDAAAWLAQHYYEHYAFTKDEAFLRERAYPMLKSVSEFWFDFLVVDPRDGSLVVSPSYSPEQGEFSAGAAISQQLVTTLLTQTADAAKILGESDPAFLGELAATLDKVDPGLRIGSWGQLQEWKEDWDTKGNTHRHVSHLVGLFPGNQISVADTPEFAEAAKVSLTDRGDGGTGWSKAWKINFWARLLDGDHSHKMLSELLKESTLDNLWDDHPPFQIDGNFGATSGVAEMLLQSHAGTIDVLPALPSAWPDGSYTGLKARGNVEVDASWAGGSLREFSVTPASSGELKVTNSYLAPGMFTLKDSTGLPVSYSVEDGVVTFQAEAGERYTAVAELALTIAVPASATSGDTVKAEVTVSATGSTPIEKAVLSLAVPADTAEGLTDWSATPQSINLPIIPAGQSHTATFDVKVGPGNASRQSRITASLTAGEAMVSGSAVIAVKEPTPCAVPDPAGTIFAWDLGEDELLDASGNNVIPVVDGTAPAVAEGPTGKSQRLDKDGFVKSTEPVVLGYLTESTFAGEFKIDAGQNSYRRLFDSQPVGGDSEGILIDLTPGNNVRIITAGVGVTTRTVMPTGKWVSLAVTIDETGVITVFIDGQAKSTDTISGYKAVNSCVERVFHVGANRGGGERQQGLVDRVAVFPKALSAAEISKWQALAFHPEVQCVTPEAAGTLLAWDMGETPLADASGRGRIPTVTGPGRVLAEGPTGSSQALDGSSYISSPVISLGLLPSATFAAEVKLSAGQNGHRRLFDSQPDSTNWDGFIIDTTPDNEIRIITAGAEPVNTHVVLPTEQWIGIVVAIDSSGAISVYLDGEKHDGGSIPRYVAIDACNERQFRFGADQNGNQVQRGAVDRIAIFPYALNEAQASDWKDLAFDVPAAPVPPVLTSIAPNHGTVDGGTVVTLTGAALADVTDVRFGGAVAAFTVASDGKITATSPAHAAGSVQVEVTNKDGHSPGLTFTYEENPVVPTESATPTPDPTESATPTPDPTESATPTPDPTESATPTPTATETPAPTATPTESETPEPTESGTVEPGPDPADSATPVPLASSTPTAPDTGSGLASTGAVIGGTVALTMLLLAAGLALVLVRRRRHVEI